MYHAVKPILATKAPDPRWTWGSYLAWGVPIEEVDAMARRYRVALKRLAEAGAR